MNKVEKIVFCISIFAFVLYISWITASYPIYQTQRSSNPLALTELSIPVLCIVIALLISNSFVLVLIRSNNRFLHICLLLQLSAATWLTPFFMSSFSRFPDTLVYTGLSQRMGDILQGNSFMFSEYAVAYPLSFIFNLIMLKVTNLATIPYSVFIFPTIISIVIVSLWYSFIGRLSNNKTAFISTVLMVMIFYIIELHPSPRVFGETLVILLLFFAICEKSYRIKTIPLLLLIPALTLTHALLPVMLMVFLVVFYLVNKFIGAGQVLNRNLNISFFLLLFITWLAWAFYQAKQTSLQILQALNNLLTYSFVHSPEETMRILPVGYIFSWNTSLRLVSLFSFVIIAGLFIGLKIPNAIKLIVQNNKNRKSILSKHAIEIIFVILSLLFAALTFILASIYGIGNHALFFFMLTLSFVSAVGVENAIKKKSRLVKIAKIGIFCWLIFLASTYTLTAYYTEPYYSYPSSEDVGLRFTTSNIHIDSKSVSMYRPERLSMYLSSDITFIPVAFPLSDRSPDVAIFLKSAYFEFSMTKNLNFVNNSYTQFYDKLSSSSELNKVYSNPSAEIFVKNGGL